MKHSLVNAIKILLFIIGFSAAIWFFLPWREVGKFAMSTASRQLNSRGTRLGWSDVSGEEDGFTVHNLTVNGMANLTFGSITIRPRIIASVLSFAPVCDITFRGCNVQIGQILNLGDGGVLVTAGSNETLLENLRTNGDFAINGYMTVNPATMRIGRTEARLNVPENFAQNMGMLRNFLPLEQEGDKWYLRRK